MQTKKKSTLYSPLFRSIRKGKYFYFEYLSAKLGWEIEVDFSLFSL